MLLGAVGAFVHLVLRQGLDEQPDHQAGHGVREAVAELRALVADHPALRLYFVSNALWELALAALKSFIVLYLIQGLGYGLQTSSLIIGAVAVVILGGAALSGKLGDRFGRLRVVTFALWIYGLGFILPAATTGRLAIAAASVPIALGGGTLMTLAYAVLMPLMPEDEHGALTGFYSLSRGVGITLGPLLAGILISVTRSSPFGVTRGYQAMWIVCAAAALRSLWFGRGMRRAREDQEELKEL